MRKLIPALALALTFLTVPASAEITTLQMQQEFRGYFGWPVPTLCTATDVNVRADASLNGPVIFSLNKDNLFYVVDCKDNDGHSWMQGYTSKGVKGWVTGKYLKNAPYAGTKRGRFGSALFATKIYDLENFSLACGYEPGAIVQNSRELFSYAPQSLPVGPHWVHGEKEADNFHIIGVRIMAPGYSIGGLEVGMHFNYDDACNFHENMQELGWWNGADRLCYENGYYWYKNEIVDRSPRPVEGFTVFVDQDKICEIRYYHIPID